MTDLECAIQASKTLEHLLSSRLGATGKGLHEKTNSVQRRLPEDSVRHLHFVATIRNKLVHEPAVSRIDNRARFERVVEELVEQLGQMDEGPARRRGRFGFRRSGGVAFPAGDPPRRGQDRKARFPWVSVIIGLEAAVAVFAYSAKHHAGVMESMIRAGIAFCLGFFWRFFVLAALFIGILYVVLRWNGVIPDLLPHSAKQ